MYKHVGLCLESIGQVLVELFKDVVLAVDDNDEVGT